MPSVTLYQMPQVVHLTEQEGVSVSSIFNRTDFNLFKNVTNEVEFLIKTVDRKPVNLTPYSLTIFIVNDATNQVVVQETLQVLNSTEDARGHRRMVLEPFKIQNLDPGFYRYTITIQGIDGAQKVIYTDQNRSIRGFTEIFEGPLPTPQQPIVIESDAFVSERSGPTLDEYFVTGPYPGAAQRDNHSGLHTLALYLDDWSGDFFVEASLENSPPMDDSEWFPVTDFTVSTQTGVKSVQFTGSYMWLRFYFKPAPLTEGKITKALLKN